MSLRFNIKQLGEDGLHLEGLLPAADLDLAGVDELIKAEKPLEYDLEVEELDNGYLVRGNIRLSLQCECSRCLKPFEHVLDMEDWACMLSTEGEEKVSINNDTIDLTPYIREDILLGFPQRPLCNADCDGLTARKTGKSKAVKKSPVPGSDGGSGAWSELNKLKF